MNGCECTIYKILLNKVSNDYVAWAFKTLARAYSTLDFWSELLDSYPPVFLFAHRDWCKFTDSRRIASLRLCDFAGNRSLDF